MGIWGRQQGISRSILWLTIERSPFFAKTIQSFILRRDGIGGRGGGGLANIECCLKFLEYALTRGISSKVTPDVDFIDEVVNQC